MALHHQQQSETTLNTNMPVMTAALAIRGPFSFKNLFAFTLHLLPPRGGLVFLLSAGLKSARYSGSNMSARLLVRLPAETDLP